MHWLVTLWGKVEVERKFIFEFEGGAVEGPAGTLAVPKKLPEQPEELLHFCRRLDAPDQFKATSDESVSRIPTTFLQRYLILLLLERY
jgi:hypothetical protein